MRAANKHPNAFTLIELVASALLTSLMLVALLNVLWGTLRRQRQLNSSRVTAFPVTSLASLLRQDLENARGMEVTSRGVNLYGFLGSDRSTGESTLTPARVGYAVHQIGDHSVLFRVHSGGSTRESGPVRLGVKAILIQPLVESEFDSENPRSSDTGGMLPLPMLFRVTVLGSNNEVLFQEVIHHHDS